MSWLQNSLGLDLLWISIWGTALAFSYLLLFRGLELLPLGDDRRVALGRVRPIVGLASALIFSLFSAQTLFSHYPTFLPLALLLVLVAFFVASRTLVSDIFAGIALRAEQSCEPGDLVRIGEIRGRVTALGPRAIVLETPNGDSALIPYSEATRLPITRTRSIEHTASRTFTLHFKDAASIVIIGQSATRAALEHHWGSITRPPEVRTTEGGVVEITVFAQAEEHLEEVETTVRDAVEKALSA